MNGTHRFVIAALALMAPLPFARAQQGQGASSSANPAVALLYAGPIGATTTGRLDVVSSLPEDFPHELLPTGSSIGAIGQGPSKAGDPVTAILMFTRLGRTGTIDAVLRVVRDKPAARAPVPGALPAELPIRGLRPSRGSH